MKVYAKAIGDICFMEVDGEVDAEHAAQLKKAIAKAREDFAKSFVLDLSQVSFIDSTGLGVLISLMRHLHEAGGRLKLVGLRDEVRSIFEITRLSDFMQIFPDEASAVGDVVPETTGR